MSKKLMKGPSVDLDTNPHENVDFDLNIDQYHLDAPSP